jgi:glycine cleavage system transcriptional repressor
MAQYVVRAFGEDRPGIAAALTWALAEAGGNLLDVSSTSLRGHFAMMLVVDGPDPRDRLQARLSESAAPLGVSVSVRQVQEDTPDRTPGTHALSVYGPDRPGIVAGISRALADQAVNITELTCRPAPEEEGSFYSMVAEIAVPPGVNIAALQGELTAVARGLGVDITLKPIEPRSTGVYGSPRSGSGPSP